MIAVPPPQLRQLTFYNRQGEVTKTVGEPTQFIVQPHFSPDGNKLAYMKRDPKTSQIDIWTYDLESNQEKNVTHDDWPENAPIWSRDGKRSVRVHARAIREHLSQGWDGTGEEEMLFRYTPGAGMVLTDASPDGKFLTFFTGVLVLVPLNGTDPLAPADRMAARRVRQRRGEFSPDGRFVAYCTDPDDPMTLDVFVRPFDSSKPDAPPPGDPVRISRAARRRHDRLARRRQRAVLHDAGLRDDGRRRLDGASFRPVRRRSYSSCRRSRSAIRRSGTT